MTDISLAGLFGAFVGTIVAAAIYYLSTAPIERRLRQQVPVASAEERESFASKLAVLRRALLTAELVVCVGGGYWLADRLWGSP